MKQFVKTNITQIIGLVLAIVGFVSLCGVEFVQISGHPIDIFSSIYLKLVFIGIAVYAGIQLIRLQEVGRKLAIIWFCSLLLVAIINQLDTYIFDDSPYFLIPPNTKYPILLIGLYLFYLVALNQLHDEEIIALMSKNNGLVRRIGMILAICMPGLGRALTGSMPAGLGLCLVYIYIMQFGVLEQDTLSMLFFGIMTWSLFSAIDGAAVKKAFEVEQRESSITESVSE
jgi:hypothetical protein